jgi:hypothetical protein
MGGGRALGSGCLCDCGWDETRPGPCRVSLLRVYSLLIVMHVCWIFMFVLLLPSS